MLPARELCVRSKICVRLVGGLCLSVHHTQSTLCARSTNATYSSIFLPSFIFFAPGLQFHTHCYKCGWLCFRVFLRLPWSSSITPSRPYSEFVPSGYRDFSWAFLSVVNPFHRGLFWSNVISPHYNGPFPSDGFAWSYSFVLRHILYWQRQPLLTLSCSALSFADQALRVS